MTEYYAGWLTEYSLSVDNLFIFLLIVAYQLQRVQAGAERLRGRLEAGA